MAGNGSIQREEPFGVYDTQVIDSKHRLLIPKPDRDLLGANFVATLMNVGCIGLYRAKDFQRQLDYLRSFDPMNDGTQTYTMLMYSGVKYNLNCDPQGRVIMPSDLLKRAEITKKVQMIGVVDVIQLWDPEQRGLWEADKKGYRAERRREIKEAYDEMVAGGRPMMVD